MRFPSLAPIMPTGPPFPPTNWCQPHGPKSSGLWGIGTRGFLGTLVEERVEMGKGERRIKEEKEGASSKRQRGRRKGEKGFEKGSIPSWDPDSPGNPHCGSGSFLLWECYQDLKGI